MYFIIETKEQLQKLPKVEKCFIDLVTLSEEAHPLLTTPSVIYYNDFSKGYIIPINHSEAFSIGIEDVNELLLSVPDLYCLDKKWHSYFLDIPHAIDVYFTILDEKNEIGDFDCYTPVHNEFYNKFKFQPDINNLIPISKHYERCECLFEMIQPFIGLERNLTWLNDYIEAYKWVEEQGIRIDEKVFDKYLEVFWKARSIKDGKIYSVYNLFNLTSRPTNAYNGLNFLAFNKDNSRSAFIPSNDVFVEFDFDGYHIRLIANLLGMDLPLDKSVHEELGRFYFKKEYLTEDEYHESKKITFRQLYNGVEEQYKEIPIFIRLNELIENLWKELGENGYVLLPNGRKLLKSITTPNKVLNYYVQCLETVNNTKKLLKLKELLKNRQSKVVLVVYDSILIDFSKQDGRRILEGIKEILQEDGYRVKVRTGANYNFSK